MHAAAELGKPVNLLTFIPSDNFSNNKHEVILRLANTRWAQAPPKREPSKILSTLPKAPGESSLLFRLGYCVNATAMEVADVLRKENIRPKRVVVSQETWQILVQLHDQDVATFHNIFTTTSSSATAPLFQEKHANGVDPVEGGAAAEGAAAPAEVGADGQPVEKAASETTPAAEGEEGKEGQQPQQRQGEKSMETGKTATCPAASKSPSGAPARGGAKQQQARSRGGSPSAGGKSSGAAKGGKAGGGGGGGGGKTRGGRGGKGPRGGKGGRGGRRGDSESGGKGDEGSFVASVAAQGRPKWLHLKALNDIGHNLIHPKIPIDEDLEDYGTWDERDLSIWTYNKRRGGGGGGGALGHRHPRRNNNNNNNWRGENGANQQGNNYNNNTGGFRGQRGQRGKRGGGGAPGGYLGGHLGGNPMAPVGTPSGVPQGGYLGAAPGGGGAPTRGRRPNRGRGGGGGGGGRGGRYVNPPFYPKYPR